MAGEGPPSTPLFTLRKGVDADLRRHDEVARPAESDLDYRALVYRSKKLIVPRRTHPLGRILARDVDAATASPGQGGR